MPQFTNPYNGQTGNQPTAPNPVGNPMGGNMMSYPMNPGNNMMTQPQPTPMDIQGWKMYTPAPNKPLVGRWVMGFDEIKPKDVPMDGSFAIFPQMDQYGNMSCIYAMIWGSDGTIKPYRFLPEMIAVDQPTIQESNSDPIKEILMNFTASMDDRMGALERRIGDILTPFTINQSPNKKDTKRTVVKESDAT